MQGSTNPDHDFSDAMDEQALADLALFVTQGQVDTDSLVNADKSSKGDAAQGQTTYDEICAACHGPEGVAITFHGFDDPEYVTTIANGNPWEFIHKVRFGQPGWPMPSAVTNNWTDAEVADILAYAQTLPEDVTLNLGGQLYDKWWVLVGEDEPTTDQPLWATQTTNERSGKDTWRCKECHGWDYQCADGAYGSGSHFTGFSGILDSASTSADELTAWLNGEANPDHDFSALGDLGIGALVTFIREETGDVSPYINDDKSANGDPARGKGMFEDTCASCHGVDGKELNFAGADDPEYVGTIARDNPWEFIHKVSFGQPGTPMPVGIGMGWTAEDVADLLSYGQTLPFE
jgi:thiosulfate dehydrogenase